MTHPMDGTTASLTEGPDKNSSCEEEGHRELASDKTTEAGFGESHGRFGFIVRSRLMLIGLRMDVTPLLLGQFPNPLKSHHLPRRRGRS